MQASVASITSREVRNAARSQAARPETIDPSLLDQIIDNLPNSRIQIFAGFIAEDSFGTESAHQIRCLLDASGLIEAQITLGQ